jgi:hypothetical protein
MKFPSLSHLASEASRTFRRFPLSISSALLGTIIAIYLVELEQEKLYLVNLILTAALGIPFFFAIRILSEFLALEKKPVILLQLGGILFLGLIYWSFPVELSFDTHRAPYIRYLIYNLTIHLFVAILPFFKSKNQLSFWNFNKLLFLRIVLGALYSFVIHSGISFALLAIMALFDAEIDPLTFLQLFIITIGVFNTWFFLAGIPMNFREGFTTKDYPRGIRVFTQFVLIPLLLIYLLILYVYGGKIILTWDWPRGIVSYMIIAISVLGIFTNLLLFPYQQFKESGWIKLFYKAFYFLLFPLIILLFLAIGIRIEDYGLTVNRYIITLLGIWLTFIAIYFTFGKKDIKVIPISLAIFMIFSSFGPWGMFGLSEQIQLDRLKGILEENGLLVEGKIQQEILWEITDQGVIKPVKESKNLKLDKSALREANSIIQYLGDYHGLSELEAWFVQDLKSVMISSASKSNLKEASKDWDQLIVETMGMKYIPFFQLDDQEGEVKELSFQTTDEFSFPVSGFEHLVKFEANRLTKGKQEKSDFDLSLESEKQSILLLKNQNREIKIDLKDFIHGLSLQSNANFNPVDGKDLRFEFSSEDLRLVFLFETIHMKLEKEELTLVSVKGLMLIHEIKVEL